MRRMAVGCRDYMNPYLPVAPFAESGLPGSGGVQAPIHSDPTAGNILLVQVLLPQVLCCIVLADLSQRRYIRC